jgi:hypothetical protein
LRAGSLPDGQDPQSRSRDPKGSACDSPTGKAGRALGHLGLLKFGRAEESIHEGEAAVMLERQKIIEILYAPCILTALPQRAEPIPG